MRISDWSSDVCSSDLSEPKEIPQVPDNYSFIARWRAARPHLPYRIVDGTTSSMGLEMLVDPQAWIVKDEDTLWDMNQPRLCGLFIPPFQRSEEHTSELQSLMRNSYAVFCLKKKKTK